MALEAFTEAIDELVECDPALYGPDCDFMVELERQAARVEAYVAASAAAFEASGVWGASGARSAVAYLARAARIPKALARRQVRLGRAMVHLPLAAAAWFSGQITGAHLEALGALRRPSTVALLERDEELLVRQAKRLRFDHFTRVLAYWEQRADAEGSEEAEAERHGRRDAYLASSLEGMWLGKMTFEAIGGAIVSNEMGRIEQDMFEEDWAKAKAELGREPKVDELWRTPGQRRADAFVEMATRSATMGEGGRRPAPLFSVLVGWETLGGPICQLAQGQALTPGSLVPWLEHVDLERAVFEPGGRVEVSAVARFFTGGTRRAIELRDRECSHEYCDVPAERCQADHIIPWSEGGPTIQENGRLLCGYHNRQRNQRPPPDD